MTKAEQTRLRTGRLRCCSEQVRARGGNPMNVGLPAEHVTQRGTPRPESVISPTKTIAEWSAGRGRACSAVPIRVRRDGMRLALCASLIKWRYTYI